MTRNAEGYTSIRQQSDQIAVALRETALLIGPLRNQPIELEPGGSVMPGLGLESDAATLLRRARDLREGIFKVIVYGEFKHGKSTLLNALLGSRILAAKTLKCTAIISVLVYGERPDVAIYTVGQEQPAFLSREEYVKQFQLTAADEETLSDKGFVDRFKEIDYAQLECQSSLCANGVRLVDSPGLGDHPSRTRVTTRYLRESHAIILMLNAMRLLSDDEKRFIETEFKPGRTHNVFFVVNRINQINQREVSEVQHYFRTFLTPYFTRNDGQFDEDLYQRRVFFINALGALEARLQPGCTNGMSELSSPAAPDPTGVLALEQELERFLTSDEKHTTALQESIGFLQSAIGEALRQIEQQKMLQDVPLHQFEQSITDAEEHLVKLSRRQQDIERTIRLFGDTIAQKLIAHLREYLDQMHATWPQDAQSLKLDAISLRNIIQGFMEGFIDKEQVRQRIEEPVRRELEYYVEAKLRSWTDSHTTALIQADLDKMVREIEEQVVEFKLELDRIAQIMAPNLVIDPYHNREQSNQWARTLIGSVLRDIGAMQGSLIEWDDWSGIFWTIVQQLLLIYIASLFSGPIGWTIFALGQVVQYLWAEQQFKQRLLERIGDELHKNLQRELPAMQKQISQDVQHQFVRLAQRLNQALQDLIDEKHHELARILLQKRDASFSADREKERLTRIGQRLVRIRDSL